MYNPILALQVMEHQGQTASFFTKWLQNLDDFIRVHDKRLSILGLCAILSCPVEQIPEVIRAGWPQLGVAFVKLFETWPDAVAGTSDIMTVSVYPVTDSFFDAPPAREELRKLHEDESDDEDEGGVEGEDVEDVEGKHNSLALRMTD